MLAEWTTTQVVVFIVPFALLLIAVAAWYFMRQTFRSRVCMEKQLRDDPDINEWLVVFGWSRKVLYVPTILVSLLAAILTYAHPSGAAAAYGYIVGGVWLGVFFLNFLVDEYEMSIKVLLIVVLCVFVAGLWLSLMGWLVPFLKLFKLLKVSLSGTAYLVLAIILFMACVISWLRGLFYYVAITPNYLNLQVGPTETGEQISREEYSTRIDTGDFLERLLGFGRIVVTFSDQRRQPVFLLVGRIGRKAAKLESIRGKLAVDRFQAHRENARDA